jgi:hypothetical protein
MNRDGFEMTEQSPSATTALELRARVAHLRQMSETAADDRLKRVYDEHAEILEKQAEALEFDQQTGPTSPVSRAHQAHPLRCAKSR